MRLSRELTLAQTLRSLERAGFDNRFRILFGRKKWALVLVHQKGEKSDQSDGPEFVDSTDEIKAQVAENREAIDALDKEQPWPTP